MNVKHVELYNVNGRETNSPSEAASLFMRERDRGNAAKLQRLVITKSRVCGVSADVINGHAWETLAIG